jgi:hypothetical protein
MLKRKCHDYGQAIRVVNGMIIICKCIDAYEIQALIKLIKEAKNADI